MQLVKTDEDQDAGATLRAQVAAAQHCAQEAYEAVLAGYAQLVALFAEEAAAEQAKAHATLAHLTRTICADHVIYEGALHAYRAGCAARKAASWLRQYERALARGRMPI